MLIIYSNGDSDVGDIVMLVTSLCWWLYDVDLFQMMATESLFWRFVRFGDILSPSLVTNIDITIQIPDTRDG